MKKNKLLLLEGWFREGICDFYGYLRENITKEIPYIEVSRYPNKPSDSAVNEKFRKIHSAHTSSKWSKRAKHWDKAN